MAALPVLSDDRSLAELRREIDAIDDSMHDLLLRRARVVAEVAAAKSREGAGAPVFRPGREAAILRRLLGRNRPPLRPELVVRVWREIIANLTALQGPFRVAVNAADAASLDLARAHFGDRLLVRLRSLPAVMAALAKGRVEIGVVPLPGAAASWWRTLPKGVQIQARLPFLSSGARGGALVLGRQAFEPSGDDGGYLRVATSASLPSLRTALKTAGFADARIVARSGRNVLVETGSWAEAARLTRLAAQVGGSVAPLGGYARPVATGVKP